jgi:hypothetical protein
MSEYITIHPEYTDNPNVIRLITNLSLAPEGVESYATPEEGDEGSPLAQTLFGIEGLLTLDMDGGEMTVRRDPEYEWHDLIDEIKEALTDFFL